MYGTPMLLQIYEPKRGLQVQQGYSVFTKLIKCAEDINFTPSLVNFFVPKGKSVMLVSLAK